MTVNIITSEDFELFQTELLKQLQEIKLLLGEIQKNKTIEYQGKKWLKSYQVQRMLGVSPGTLQNLRINGTLPFSKIGGIIFYSYEDILETMKKHKSKAA